MINKLVMIINNNEIIMKNNNKNIKTIIIKNSDKNKTIKIRQNSEKQRKISPFLKDIPLELIIPYYHHVHLTAAESAKSLSLSVPARYLSTGAINPMLLHH